jgi:thiol-disulfide isomerase/thioredoxin
MSVKGIYVVYADWCPHCVPTAVEPIKKAAHKLGVPLHLYDIDTDDVGKADEIVEKYGDWTPDYLIPQVFVELDGGKIEHVLTGDRRGVAFTRKAVEDFLRGLGHLN